jgi:hypothetical protein
MVTYFHSSYVVFLIYRYGINAGVRLIGYKIVCCVDEDEVLSAKWTVYSFEG